MGDLIALLFVLGILGMFFGGGFRRAVWGALGGAITTLIAALIWGAVIITVVATLAVILLVVILILRFTRPRRHF